MPGLAVGPLRVPGARPTAGLRSAGPGTPRGGRSPWSRARSRSLRPGTGHRRGTLGSKLRALGPCLPAGRDPEPRDRTRLGGRGFASSMPRSVPARSRSRCSASRPPSSVTSRRSFQGRRGPENGTACSARSFGCAFRAGAPGDRRGPDRPVRPAGGGTNAFGLAVGVDVGRRPTRPAARTGVDRRRFVRRHGSGHHRHGAELGPGIVPCGNGRSTARLPGRTRTGRAPWDPGPPPFGPPFATAGSARPRVRLLAGDAADTPATPDEIPRPDPDDLAVEERRLHGVRLPPAAGSRGATRLSEAGAVSRDRRHRTNRRKRRALALRRGPWPGDRRERAHPARLDRHREMGSPRGDAFAGLAFGATLGRSALARGSARRGRHKWSAPVCSPPSGAAPVRPFRPMEEPTRTRLRVDRARPLGRGTSAAWPGRSHGSELRRPAPGTCSGYPAARGSDVPANGRRCFRRTA